VNLGASAPAQHEPKSPGSKTGEKGPPLPPGGGTGGSSALPDLSEKPLEELILSLHLCSAFSVVPPDSRFRYVNLRDAEDTKRALEENRRIIQELRDRRRSNRELPRTTLLKYRGCPADLYTGGSGPHCTVENVCALLLGEYDDDAGPEAAELPEF